MSPILKVALVFSPALAAILAAVEDGGLERFGAYAILTGVLGWFMKVADSRLRGIEHGLNGMRRMMLIEILARSNDATVKRLCNEELRKVDPGLADEMAAR